MTGTAVDGTGQEPRAGTAATGAAPGLAGGPTGDLLLQFLAEQRDRLVEHRHAALAGEADAVHAVRVACRRARSALSTYAPVLLDGAADELREELRRLGAALGGARDAEVVRGRLDDLLASQPESDERRRVSARLGLDLDHRAEAGREEARLALAGPRHVRLLDDLGAFLTEPPLVPRVGPAVEVVPLLLATDWRRLRSRAARAALLSGVGRDAARHEVRKAAKRLRYAAQAAQPALGKRAGVLAQACADVQDALGDHRDSTAAGAALHGLAGSTEHEDDRRLLRRLHERQQQDARALEHAYAAAYGRLRRVRRRDWPELG